MRPLFSHTAYKARKVIVSTTLAAAMPLFGCAVEPTPGLAQPGSDCRMDSLLYCDLAPHVDRCQCIRHSDFRDMLRTLSRR